jgi:hypothetical protein
MSICVFTVGIFPYFIYLPLLPVFAKYGLVEYYESGDPMNMVLKSSSPGYIICFLIIIPLIMLSVRCVYTYFRHVLKLSDKEIYRFGWLFSLAYFIVREYTAVPASKYIIDMLTNPPWSQ